MQTNQQIHHRLAAVYGAAAAATIGPQVTALLARYAGQIPARPAGWSERDALLITYADSLRGTASPLATLHQFLRDEVGEALSFVHLLPFFPSSSDDGFAVEDFRAVRDDLGTWAEVRRMATDYRLVFDGVINHVSQSSRYMQGYCAGDPAYADFFLALDPATDTRSVLRTRNLPLLHDYETHAGKRWLWTTFSRDQVDLNFQNPRVLLEILDVLLGYAANGAAMIRLDAIPYLWKELGTSCAHRPQTHELIKLMRAVLDSAAPHVLLLTETNVPHRENITYFGDRGDEAQLIYNFALAPLILWSLVKGDGSVLTDWARGIEKISDRATYLNITATHDGIGMRPTEGILTEPQRAELVQLARDHGGDVTGKRNSDGSISPYELNLNYFDAVNDPRRQEPADLPLRRFLVSQAIPLALIGVPGLYIHSLLGSRNDSAGVQATGRARSINREQLELAQIRQELATPQSLRSRVFAELKRWLLLRSRQSAFHPDATQRVLDFGPALFAVERRNERTGQRLVALHNLRETGCRVPVQCGCRDLLTGERDTTGEMGMAPYQVRWLEEQSERHSAIRAYFLK